MNLRLPTRHLHDLQTPQGEGWVVHCGKTLCCGAGARRCCQSCPAVAYRRSHVAQEDYAVHLDHVLPGRCRYCGGPGSAKTQGPSAEGHLRHEMRFRTRPAADQRKQCRQAGHPAVPEQLFQIQT